MPKLIRISPHFNIFFSVIKFLNFKKVVYTVLYIHILKEQLFSSVAHLPSFISNILLSHPVLRSRDILLDAGASVKVWLRLHLS